MNWEVPAERVILWGAGRCEAGVELAGEGKWLRAAGWVARTWIDVAEIRERLIEESRGIVASMSIDYCSDLGLCGRVWAEQAAFAGWAMERLGTGGGGMYRTDGSRGAMAGPGAVYHVDKGFGQPAALFVVTSILGGGVLCFPHLGLELSLEPGQTVLFDALHVHGVLPGNGGKVGTQPFVVVSSEVMVSEAGARRLGLVSPERPAGSIDLDEAEVEPDTGRLMVPEYG
jgi:hypothetical protein